MDVRYGRLGPKQPLQCVQGLADISGFPTGGDAVYSTGSQAISAQDHRRSAEAGRRGYRNAGSAPTNAVKRAFGCSDRTAGRYVTLAREAGLLPETTQGKVSK